MPSVHLGRQADDDSGAWTRDFQLSPPLLPFPWVPCSSRRITEKHAAPPEISAELDGDIRRQGFPAPHPCSPALDHQSLAAGQTPYSLGGAASTSATNRKTGVGVAKIRDPKNSEPDVCFRFRNRLGTPIGSSVWREKCLHGGRIPRVVRAAAIRDSNGAAPRAEAYQTSMGRASAWPQ